MAGPEWRKRVVALIKWGKSKYLEDLVDGKVYLNTPEFYRVSADKGFGDKYESCAYSYRKGRDEVAPVILKEGVLLSGFCPTSATIYGASRISLYLHCWSMISAWDDAHELEAMVSDLREQRQKLGPCFVALRSRDIGVLLERIRASEPTARCSHIEYSDDANKQNCVCKRTRFAWQREFRFLVGECGERDTKARSLHLGDLSDLLLFDGILNVSGTEGSLSIAPDGIALVS